MTIKTEKFSSSTIFLFGTQIFKGLGQIMLQENAITGLLFLIGIFYGSLFMGCAALAATIAGTLTAKVFRYDTTEINKGLYGFSAALVGVAVALFLKAGILSWAILVIGSVLAAVIQHLFIKRNIPAFTFPFVLVTWFILFFVRHYLPGVLAEAPPASVSENLTFALKGFGQVIFQDNNISGMLFFLAVFISSPISALYGLAGATLSAILASYFSMPLEAIGLGLFSFNAVLCAIVFAGSRIEDGIWVFISVLLSLGISIFMLQNNLYQLTFPFVAASVVTLAVKTKLLAGKK